MSREKEAGQVAVIVALTMAVMATVTLSVVSSSIVDLRLTDVEEESSAALKAAEAGLEQALKGLRSDDFSSSDFPGASYEVDVESRGESGFITASSIDQGEVIEVELGGSSPPSDLVVYWSDKNDDSQDPPGAVEVLRYGKISDSDYRVSRYVYDPDATRRSQNNFEDFGAPTIDPPAFQGVEFAASASIPLDADDQLVRIRTFYNSMTLGISPQNGTLPSQIYEAVSTGKSEDEQVQRRVRAVRGAPQLPAVFDAALYSGGSL